MAEVFGAEQGDGEEGCWGLEEEEEEEERREEGKGPNWGSDHRDRTVSWDVIYYN